MDQEIINSYSKLSGLNVSRETFSDFESYISMILEKNEKINSIYPGINILFQCLQSRRLDFLS